MRFKASRYKLHYYATIVLALFPLFPMFFKNLAAGIWAFALIYIAILSRRKTGRPILLTILFSSLYFFYFVSFFYSSNSSEAINQLVKRLPLLIAPVVFYFFPLRFYSDTKSTILKVFNSGLLLMVSSVILYLLFNGIINDISNARNPIVFIRHTFENYTDLHPSYLSLFLSFSFLNILNGLIDKWKSIRISKRMFFAALLFYILIILVLLSAKMSIIALGVISVLILFLRLKNRVRLLYLLVPALVFVFVLIAFVPTTRVRFQKLAKAITSDTIDNKNPDFIRKGVYQSSFELIKENFLFGVGVGDVQDKLVKQYKKNKYRKAARLNLNTHNQYFEIWLAGGIVPLLFFIASLIIPIYLSLANKDYYYFSFLLLMGLCLLTENLLSRQVGIIFFAFFNSFFAFNFNRKDGIIYINGRFLTQKLSGVQRFASEISRELQPFTSTFLLSPKAIKGEYKNLGLSTKPIKLFNSHFWEQITLPLYLETKGSPLLINLANTAPIFYRNKISTVHDLSFLKNPAWFSRFFHVFYKFLIPRVCLSSRKVLTVSGFSKKELIKYLGLYESKIEVIYNAVPKAFVDEKKFLATKNNEKYILSVGTFEPRKNIATLIKAFNKLDIDHELIIVGNTNPKVFRQDHLELPPYQNKKIKFIVGATDKELVALYKNASCFIYIPLYEGFGLPVLEAMNFGCPTIISDIEVFREVYGDATVYVDPSRPTEIAQKIEQLLCDQKLCDKSIVEGYIQSKKYSFTDSAIKIKSIIEDESQNE